MIEHILTDAMIGVSEFKKNPIEAVEEAGGQPIAVLSNNKPQFYCLSKDSFEELMELVEDMRLGEVAVKREQKKNKRIKADF